MSYIRILEKFKEIAQNPRKQLDSYKKMGKKAIGCFPVYAPEEIIYASGMIPFGIWGAEFEVSEAKRYNPAYVCGVLQTSLELGLKGALDGLSGVVASVLCDSLKCFEENWKCAVPHIRIVPVIHPQNRKSTGSREFLIRQYENLCNIMEKISGNEIKEADLKESIKVYNEHRRIMRKFTETAAAYPGIITPLYRNFVIKSGYFIDKAEHTTLVEELITELEKEPVKRYRGIRVVTTGIIADSENMLEILRENKVSIAADEVAHESRQFRVDVCEDKDSIEALAEQFLNMYGCSLLSRGTISRKDYIVELVRKSKADGVLILMTKFCDPEEYDYPAIKKRLDEEGIPSLLIETDKQVRNYEQARTSIQTFAEILR